MTKKEERTYVLTSAQMSRCPVCKERVTTLATRGFCYRMPGFWICWPCQKVWRAGVAEVRRES